MAVVEAETTAARRIGGPIAGALAGLGLAYAAVLVPGLSSLTGPGQPISDPWFTMLELLIVLMAPLLPLLWAAIHLQAASEARVLTLAGLMFVSLTAALTSGVHVLILTLARGAGSATPHWLAFRWPSAAYAVDILAWDVFFGLAALLAGFGFRRGGLDGVIRALLFASGSLSLAGLLGPVTGAMDLRLIGVVGYAVVFPVAAGFIAIRFRRSAAGPSSPGQRGRG